MTLSLRYRPRSNEAEAMDSLSILARLEDDEVDGTGEVNGRVPLLFWRWAVDAGVEEKVGPLKSV